MSTTDLMAGDGAIDRRYQGRCMPCYLLSCYGHQGFVACRGGDCDCLCNTTGGTSRGTYAESRRTRAAHPAASA